MAAARDERLDVDALASELDVAIGLLDDLLEEIDRCGLALVDREEHPAPMLLTAGSQYLAAGGVVDRDVLVSLARTLDDLHARRAVLIAGSLLVDAFRAAILAGDGVEHARMLVPPAFASAITDDHVLDLFAAAVALTTRLPRDEPPGCVAEEVMMVRLMEEASAVLDDEVDAGRLSRPEQDAACDELRGLFDLAQDDDVLDLFAMEEPGDAAVAGHDPLNRQLGIVDQRLEAWYQPFGWTVATGYLDDPAPAEEEDDEDE